MGYTMKEIYRFAETARNVVTSYGLNPPEPDKCPIVLNGRISRAYGRCRSEVVVATGEILSQLIELQKKLVESPAVTENDIMTVLIHEYLHACFPLDGHTGKWKQYADEITHTSKYDIHRTATFTEFEKTDKKARYIIECSKCHQIWKYYKRPGIYDMLDHCRCPICNEYSLVQSDRSQVLKKYPQLKPENKNNNAITTIANCSYEQLQLF